MSRPAGGIESADDRIDDPSLIMALPSRLGGGYLFLVGDTVLRADDWLARPRPIFRSSRGLQGGLVGLDRVYARTGAGSFVAFDPRTGGVLDPGAWPADPRVEAYVALDGWRALALTDLRGLVSTTDAGRTWDRVDLPVRPRVLVAVRRDPRLDAWVETPTGAEGEAAVVSDTALRGNDARASASPGASRCYLVTDAQTVARLESCDSVLRDGTTSVEAGVAGGSRDLRAAVADGWPLGDGTAAVVADGALVRVSLTDGARVAVASDAVDRRFTRCHAVGLARPSDPAAFGFVCGEPAGRTALFVYDDSAGRLRPVRAFASPRRVQVAGGGAWIVRGPCGDEPSAARASTLCVGAPTHASAAAQYAWRELAGGDDLAEVVTVTSDGRVARLSVGSNLAAGHLALGPVDGATVAVPLRLDGASEGVRRFVAHAVWLGDLEEKAPGVLGGWLTADGTVLGVEIDAEGGVRTGAYIRDLGSPFVSGRYGLGWTRSHLGYETTDGGMTWAPFVAPAPLGPSRARACGPAGCIAEGWIRVGWGERASAPPVNLRPEPPLRGSGPAPLRLTCRPAQQGLLDLLRRGSTAKAVDEPRRPSTSTPKPPASLAARLRDGLLSPAIAATEALVQVDVFSADATTRQGPLGRIFAWGPATGEWAGAGRWTTRWRSPFVPSTGAVSTSVSAAPFADADSARAELGVGRAGPVSWTLVAGEDAAHALLLSRRPGRAPELMALDEGAPPVPVRRVDGAPWGAIDAALRVGSDWFIAAPEDATRGSITIFRTSSEGAARFASVARYLAGSNAGAVRLARRDSGGAIGVVIDGDAAADRPGARRWALPISLASGESEPPEPLGAADLGDREALAACGDSGGAGWLLDTTWPSAGVTLDLGRTAAPAALRQVALRLRLSTDRACIERLAGQVATEELARSIGHEVAAPVRGYPAAALSTGQEPSFAVVAVADGAFALRCDRAQK